MAGSRRSKKDKRKERKKESSNNGGASSSSGIRNSNKKNEEDEGPWYSCMPDATAMLGANTVKVSGGEMVDLMGGGPMGLIIDSIQRNLVRGTQQAFTRNLAALPELVGNNFLWLQLLLLDEDRVIQGKFYELGGVVSSATDKNSLVGRRSRDLFREAAPYLLLGAKPGVAPPHWVFSRSMLLTNYTGSLDENVYQFSEYDPVGSLLEFPKDVGQRCTEAFLLFAGDFTVRDNGSSREAVTEFVRDLTTEDILKLNAFSVCCSTVKVAENKLKSLKNVHMVV